MANAQQLEIIQQGVGVWNAWRKKNPSTVINLAGADLSKRLLFGADFRNADPSHADLIGTRLVEADFSGANLRGANIADAYMMKAVFNNADLRRVNAVRTDFMLADFTDCTMEEGDFLEATFIEANFKRANLVKASLKKASLVQAKVDDAIMDGCLIFGLSAWALSGVPQSQSGLVITEYGEAQVTVDDLQVAQFVHLLLNNQTIRNVIESITSKAVLILGRFTEERKTILDALYAELRKRNYLPILFDFTGPENRDITETVSTLAHMARFIIADITDAKSIPQELQAIVPNLPSVPVKPLLLASQTEYGMFAHFKRYPWVLPTWDYQDTAEVISGLSEHILNPLEAKVRELTGKG